MELKFSKVGEDYTQKVEYKTIKAALKRGHFLSRRDSFNPQDFLDKRLVCIFNTGNATDNDKTMLTIDSISKEAVLGKLIGGKFINGRYSNPIFGGLAWNEGEIGIYFKNFENDYEISLVNIMPIEIDELDKNYIARKITNTNDYDFYELFKLLSENQREYLDIKKKVSYTLGEIVGEASE